MTSGPPLRPAPETPFPNLPPIEETEAETQPPAVAAPPTWAGPMAPYGVPADPSLWASSAGWSGPSWPARPVPPLSSGFGAGGAPSLGGSQPSIPTMGSPGMVGMSENSNRPNLIAQLAVAQANNTAMDPSNRFLAEKSRFSMLAQLNGIEDADYAWALAEVMGALALEFPSIWEWATEGEFDTVIRLTDEEIQTRLRRGEIDVNSQLSRDLLAASDETLSGILGPSYAAYMMNRDLVWVEQSYKAGELAHYSGMDFLDNEDIAALQRAHGTWQGIENTWSQRVLSGELPISRTALPPDGGNISWQSISERGGRWFLTEDGMLGLGVDIDIGGPTPQTSWSLVRLDPGTPNLTNAHEAATAYLLALQGKQHTLVQTSQIPGVQTGLGRAFQTAGNIVQWVESLPVITPAVNGIIGSLRKFLTRDADYEVSWDDSADIRAQQAQERGSLLAQEYAQGVIGADEAVLLGARQLTADPDFQVTPNEAILAASLDFGSLTATEQQDFIGEVTRLTQAQIEPYYTELFRDRPVLTEAMKTGGGFLLESLAMYDQWIHSGVIHLMGYAVGAKEAIFGREEDGVHTYGWDAFKASTDDLGSPENRYLSDYWGIEGSGAFFLDLSTSVMFDPITWVCPGGAGLFRWSKALISDPSLAGTAFKHFPALRHAARQALVKNNPQGTVMFTRGMSGAGIRRMAELAADPTARWNSHGMTEIMRVFQHEIANGAYIPYSATRAGAMRTVEGIGQIFGGWGQLNKAGRSRTANMYLNATQHRGISLGADEWLDEAIDLISTAFPRDRAEFMKALNSALSAHDAAVLAGGIPMRQALENNLKALRQSVRKQNAAWFKAQVPEVRGFKKTQKRLWDYQDVADNVRAEIDRFTAGTPPLDRRSMTKAEKARDAARLHISSADQARYASHSLTWLDTEISGLQRIVDDFGEARKTYLAGRKEYKAKITAANRMLNHLDDPVRTQYLIDWTTDFMDEWGARVLERKGYKADQIWTSQPNRLHSNPSKKRLNWRLILDPESRWKKTRIIGVDDDIGFWAPFYTDADGVVDEALRKQLEGSGFYVNMKSMPLAVSPYELLAFDNMPDLKLWRDFRYSVPTQKFMTGLSRVQSGFSFDVLMNLMTPLRTGLDEPLRYLVEFGDWKGFLKTVGMSVPGAGRLFGLSPDPLVAAATREINNPALFRSPQWVFSRPGMKGHPQAVERWLMGQGREIEGMRVWADAYRSGNWDTYRHWYEGTYAKSRPDRSHRVVSKKGTGSKILPWHQSYESITAGFEKWLDMMVDNLEARGLSHAEAIARRNRLRDRIVRCWAENKRFDELYDMNSTYRLLRDAPLAPAEVYRGESILGQRAPGTKAAGVSFGDRIDQFWEVLYGTPQKLRQGVFYEGYRDYAMSIYSERFNGRLVDEDWVMSLNPGMTADQARIVLARPSQGLVQAAQQAGRTWPRQIEMWADRFARRHANDLMYQFVSSSLFGSHVRQFYNPFARAGADFVRWWGKKLFEPMSIGLSPNAHRAVQAAREVIHPLEMAKAGRAARAANAARGTLAADASPLQRIAYREATQPESTLGRIWNAGNEIPAAGALHGGVTVLPIPFNVRLWSRFSHIFGAAERERDMEAEWAAARGEDPDDARRQAGRNMIGNMWGGPTTPLGILQAFSFFPDDLKADNLLIDLFPQPGYLPVGVMLLLSEAIDADQDHPLRKVLADIFPALQYYDTTVLDSYDALSEIAWPIGGRSVRGGLGSLWRLIDRDAGKNHGWLGEIIPFLLGARSLPPGTVTRASAMFGDWLNQNAFKIESKLGGPEWSEAADEMYLKGLSDANFQLGRSRVLRPVSPFVNSRIPAEQTYIAHYRPIIEDLQLLVDAHLATEATAGNITDLWTRWENTGQQGNNDLTDDELGALSSWLADIYYGDAITVSMTDQMNAAYDQAVSEQHADVITAAIAAGIPALIVRNMSPEELTTLDSKRTFIAGLPQAVTDDWLIRYPGLSVNLVSKLRARTKDGEPDIPDEYALYFYPDGRLDNTTLMGLGFQEAHRIRSQMLAEGVLQDRNYKANGDGWMEDAHRLVYNAARRDMARLFERIVTSQGWPEAWKSTQTDAVLGATFRRDLVDPLIVERLATYGYDLPETFTGAELRGKLGSLRSGFLSASPTSPQDNFANASIARHVNPPGDSLGILRAVNAVLEATGGQPVTIPTGDELMTTLTTWTGTMGDMGYEAMWDYPEWAKTRIREDIYERALDLGYLTQEDYRRSGLNRILGVVGSRGPDLTSVSQFDQKTMFTVQGDSIRSNILVVDGDTLQVVLPTEGTITVRLQGINAADTGQPGATEATHNLETLLAGATTVTFGFYQPERYGVYQVADPTTGQVRIKLFMAVDGVIILDPNTYTATSPGGVRTGTPWYVPPILDIYNRGRDQQGEVD